MRAQKERERKRAADGQELFLDYLASQGCRITAQRRRVASVLFNASGHLTADELCVLVRRRDPRVSRASVYRTLDLLARSGLVEATAFQDDTKRYENTLDRGHHDHLVCTACGAVEEFHSEPIETTQRLVANRRGFEPHWHSLKIYGLCRSCRRAGGKSGKPAKAPARKNGRSERT